MLDFTGGQGADVILDIMAAAYLPRNIAALATGGRLIVIGMQGGTRGELDLGQLMRKRATVHGSTLRSRPPGGEGGDRRRGRVTELWPLVERRADQAGHPDGRCRWRRRPRRIG